VNHHYSGAAEALFAVIEDDVLSGCGAGLRPCEAYLHAAGADVHAACDVRLPVAQLGGAVERRGRGSATDPVRLDRLEATAQQGRMIRALDDHERIARDVLGGDEPRRVTAAREPADAEAAALAERIALEPAMAADHGAVMRLDRSRPAWQPAPDEVPERALADEADAGRVALVRHRQPALARERAHLRLAQPAYREFRVPELRGLERMQEVALVLVAVDGAQQPAAVADTRVVTGREALGAEAPGVVEPDAELDLAVAEHVGVRRATRLELGEESREDALPVLGREARLVQRDAELVADAPRILEIRG